MTTSHFFHFVSLLKQYRWKLISIHLLNPRAASLRFLFLIFNCYGNSLIFQLKNCLQISSKKNTLSKAIAMIQLNVFSMKIFKFFWNKKKFSHCWRYHVKKNKLHNINIKIVCLISREEMLLLEFYCLARNLNRFTCKHTYQVRLACI